MNRSQDYDLKILKANYVDGRLSLAGLDYEAGRVLNGGRIHDHDWVSPPMYFRTFEPPIRQEFCAKCGERRNT